MSVEASTHKCLFTGRSCGSGTVENGEKKPALTEKPNSLCPSCLKSVERAGNDSPETFARLHAVIGDKYVRPSHRVSGTRLPPIPLNVDVAAAMDRLVEWLVVGAERVTDAMKITEDVEPGSRSTAEQARVVKKCRNIICPNVERLIESEEETVQVWRTMEALTFRDMTGADVAYEIVRANNWGRRILNYGEKQEHACPLCLHKAVYRIVAWSRGGKTRDIVECQNCGKTWEYENYQLICGVALRAIEEEQVDKAERAELEELRAKNLPDLEARLALAEAKAERLERGFRAALDPEFNTMSAKQFAETILRETA